MIVYSLRCANKHEFEAWFKDSKSFDRQAKKRAVECPECGDTKIEKAIMAPRLNSRSGGELADLPEKAKQVRQVMNMMRKHVEENCDYVGEKFAEEARAIHYGEKEERDIYGEATLAEVKELVEEEIPVAPVPTPSRKRKAS